VTIWIHDAVILVHWKKVAYGAFFETLHSCRRKKARFLPPASTRIHARISRNASPFRERRAASLALAFESESGERRLIRDEGHWVELTDRFHAAAIDGQGWYPALEGLADATGSSSGELICLTADAAVHLNIMTNASPELLEAFIACNGGDPKVNPRVKAGMEAPVLKVLAESDFLTPDEHKRHPHYREFARPFDIPYICLATLDRPQNGLIGLAVTRSEKQGHIDAEQRRAFASIAPHVRAAVRTHISLEGHGDALLAGALEAICIPAFVCVPARWKRSAFRRSSAMAGDVCASSHPRRNRW
jgi:hypothetical protein